ncbi:MAG: O-antigen ligase family protein [Erythrobacter sp.]|uniref:O-antigen ligase family protein n=1 Tax=Erythrobacter sp. TaxID=1042 RepID=UPI001AFFA423|nr:O-antigen ligase family protein [Erythrobacter sp.]MBO6768981.1 O-antigen ligase family protein [Erythrobacter sp.]
MRALYIPALAFLAFSYPATTVLGFFANTLIDQANLVLKLVFAAMFGISLLAALSKGKVRLPWLSKPIMFFFLLYGLRLGYDIFVKGIAPPNVEGSYIAIYFYFLTLLPALSIAVAFQPGDLARLRRVSFYTLFASCVLILLYFLESGASAADFLRAQRLEIRGDGEVAAVLNPITIGITGGLLVAFAIGQLAVRGSLSRSDYSFSFCALALGLVCLLLSGSRGPFVAFIFALLFYFASVVARYHQAGGQSKELASRSFQFLFALGSIIGVYFIIKSGDLLLSIARLAETSALSGERGSEIRNLIYRDAIASFVDSPVLGHSYLAYGQTAYAHNALLEAFLATGLIGGLIFSFSLVAVLKSAWTLATKLLSRDALPWALVTVMLVTLSMVSKTLSQSPDIWLIAVLTLCAAERGASHKALSTSAQKSGNVGRLPMTS